MLSIGKADEVWENEKLPAVTSGVFLLSETSSQMSLRYEKKTQTLPARVQIHQQVPGFCISPGERGSSSVQVSGKQTSPENITQITSEMLGTAKADGTQQLIGCKRVLM